MKTITINLHYCSREEEKELIEYLENNCWDFRTSKKDDKKEESILYILSENAINGITINEKIANDDLYEYRIIDRADFLDDLIRWISEAKDSDKFLMKNDLKMLMDVKDKYILSSINTNDYLYIDCKEFNNTCKELLELNDNLKS